MVKVTAIALLAGLGVYAIAQYLKKRVYQTMDQFALEEATVNVENVNVMIQTIGLEILVKFRHVLVQIVRRARLMRIV
jgi:hypothetical protein